MSHYDTLGVPKDADSTAIKRAWRKKASSAHTDREGGDHNTMIALNKAYETLRDPERRQRYDETGQDSVPVPEDLCAMEMIVSYFMQAASKFEETTDLMDLVRQALRETIQQGRNNCAQLDGKAKRFESHRARVKHKAKHSPRNCIDGALEYELGKIRENMALIRQTISRAERALVLVEDYQYDVLQMPEIVWTPLTGATTGW